MFYCRLIRQVCRVDKLRSREYPQYQQVEGPRFDTRWGRFFSEPSWPWGERALSTHSRGLDKNFPISILPPSFKEGGTNKKFSPILLIFWLFCPKNAPKIFESKNCWHSSIFRAKTRLLSTHSRGAWTKTFKFRFWPPPRSKRGARI